MTDSIIRDFVAEQRELLNLEFEADADENSTTNEERAAHILSNLEASDISVGLYGRTVVQLTLLSDNKTTGELLLPAHRFTVGDEVQIRKQNKKKCPSGVISAVSDTFVNVALFQQKPSQKGKEKSQAKKKGDNDNGDQDEIDVLNQPPLVLVPQSSIEVHRKLVKALGTLEKEGTGHPIAGRIIESMFHTLIQPSHQGSIKKKQEIEPFNMNLDNSQLEAISFALQSNQDISLIHGPPGTGKTTTVAELIHQAVHVHKMKVLVTAPSNVAVDNILERLVVPTHLPESSNARGNRKTKMRRALRTIRLGHPARIKASILKYSLEAAVQNADGTEIVTDIRKELQSFLRVLSNQKSKPNDRRVAYREMKALRKEIRTREEKVVQELLASAQVVLATTVGASSRLLGKIENGFDLVVIDEAAQALEASCWIPILNGRKVVLAGDHCQLPPTIKARHQRAQVGLSKTMFERLMQLYGDDRYGKEMPRISRMLRVQYRMHHDIADWASQAMYGGELQTHESVREQTLSQLEAIGKLAMDEELAETRLLLVDTAGCEYFETMNMAGSRFNEGEASIVVQHARKLIGMGLDQSQLAIITPYNGQVELLRSLLLHDFPRLEIRSVDGFQGGEREAVILSLVRSSDRGGKEGIGFLRDDRRQNVAITRAKRHLAVVCDSETVCQSKFIQNLISWIEENGEQRSAVEFAAQEDAEGYEYDLLSAEFELLKMVTSEIQQTETKKKTIHSKKSDDDIKLAEQKRKDLMDFIFKFAENGSKGDEMKLSTELSSYDRRLAHELSEQIGLGHKSEGVEGVDRRVILSIQKESTLALDAQKSEDQYEESAEQKLVDSPFSALAIVGSDSDFDENNEDTIIAVPDEANPAVQERTGDAAGNALLSQLARERVERHHTRLKANSAPLPAAISTSKNKKNKKKGKRQKLGGKKKVQGEPEENLDGLDDMAFLDAQIEKAQNSHGRKVEGKGNYRTVINGILNARPKPQSKPKNINATTALKSKLKEAQNERRAKPKKKK